MRTALLAAAATVAFSSVAIAADLPNMKAPPAYTPPPPALTWTGFYAGVNAGAGWSDQTGTTSVPGAPNTLTTVPFDGSLGWGAVLPGTSRVGFTGGGQIGYNWQVSQIVFGAETDFQYDGGTSINNSTFTSTTPLGTGVITNNEKGSTPWFGTARVRLGTTAINPALLIYATGGFAYGREYASDAMSVTSGGALVETFPFSTGQTRIGFAIGGGLEWKFAPNWSVKAEYLYVNLAANNGQTLATTTLGPGALTTDTMRFNPGRDILNVARVGVNYQFDFMPPPTPVVAKY